MIALAQEQTDAVWGVAIVIGDRQTAEAVYRGLAAREHEVWLLRLLPDRAEFVNDCPRPDWRDVVVPAVIAFVMGLAVAVLMMV